VPLVIREANAPAASCQGLFQNPVLFDQKANHLNLLLVHPAAERYQESLQMD